MNMILLFSIKRLIIGSILAFTWEDVELAVHGQSILITMVGALRVFSLIIGELDFGYQ